MGIENPFSKLYNKITSKNEQKETGPITIKLYNGNGFGGPIGSLTYHVEGKEIDKIKDQTTISEEYAIKYAKKIARKYNRPVILEKTQGRLICNIDKNGNEEMAISPEADETNDTKDDNSIEVEKENIKKDDTVEIEKIRNELKDKKSL